MKNILAPITILIILLIWSSFSAIAINPISKVSTSNTANSNIAGTMIGEQTFKPTQVSGSASSGQSNQGQTGAGSNQGQTGSDQGQTGSYNYPANAPSVYPSPSPTYQISENNLWISTSQGRMIYAAVPQYSSVSLIASTTIGGQAVVYELYPPTTNQSTYTENMYSFVPGDNQLGFVANIVGRHILLFSINNQMSNGVIIDVQNTDVVAQQSNGVLLGRGVS